ncbi:MAG: hypothetical protein JWQ40_4064 [Segetibacter sp.]|nr:hypothetical protein [Segetibacter sp.]
MKAKLIANPYIIYCFAFLFVMLLYPLRWSALYPELSTGLICFLSATIFINFFAGLIVHNTNYLSYTTIDYDKRKIWLFTALIILSYIAECLYMGVIPIYDISTGGDYDYTSFGIPTFHVVVVTFNSFWAVFIFHNMISEKKRGLIIPYILCLVPSIVIFNRAMFLLIIASSLFVLLMSAKNILTILFKIFIFLILILFLFGIAGNVRLTRGDSANDIILAVGHATDKFEKSPVPDQFFWAYLYSTSSLGNLQETINAHRVSEPSFEKAALFINSEIFPDFISKRNEYLFKHIEAIDQISASFTVGTVYARSFAYFRWWGMVAMYIYMFLFNLCVIFSLTKSSKYFVTGVAILNCVILFSIFDNMFTFSGLVLQLAYPILFGILSRIRLAHKLNVGAVSIDNSTAAIGH